MMDINRSEILEQLASGRISAEQAAQQLRGPAATPPAAQPPLPPVPAAPVPPAPRFGPAGDDVLPAPPQPPLSAEQKAQLANHWLRIRVSDLETGRQKVAVNLPLTLVSVGLKLGARYAPEIAGLDPNEILAMLQSGANGPVVDVEDTDDGQHVQIFID
jgi:hypothetical protein